MPNTKANKLVFARQMVEQIESALLTGAAGVTSISIDGVNTVFNRQQLLAELAIWEKKVARYSRSSNSRTTTINLGNSHG